MSDQRDVLVRRRVRNSLIYIPFGALEDKSLSLSAEIQEDRTDSKKYTCLDPWTTVPIAAVPNDRLQSIKKESNELPSPDEQDKSKLIFNRELLSREESPSKMLSFTQSNIKNPFPKAEIAFGTRIDDTRMSPHKDHLYAHMQHSNAEYHHQQCPKKDPALEEKRHGAGTASNQAFQLSESRAFHRAIDDAEREKELVRKNAECTFQPKMYTAKKCISSQKLSPSQASTSVSNDLVLRYHHPMSLHKSIDDAATAVANCQCVSPHRSSPIKLSDKVAPEKAKAPALARTRRRSVAPPVSAITPERMMDKDAIVAEPFVQQYVEGDVGDCGKEHKMQPVAVALPTQEQVLDYTARSGHERAGCIHVQSPGRTLESVERSEARLRKGVELTNQRKDIQQSATAFRDYEPKSATAMSEHLRLCKEVPVMHHGIQAHTGYIHYVNHLSQTGATPLDDDDCNPVSPSRMVSVSKAAESGHDPNFTQSMRSRPGGNGPMEVPNPRAWNFSVHTNKHKYSHGTVSSLLTNDYSAYAFIADNDPEHAGSSINGKYATAVKGYVPEHIYSNDKCLFQQLRRYDIVPGHGEREQRTNCINQIPTETGAKHPGSSVKSFMAQTQCSSKRQEDKSPYLHLTPKEQPSRVAGAKKKNLSKRQSTLPAGEAGSQATKVCNLPSSYARNGYFGYKNEPIHSDSSLDSEFSRTPNHRSSTAVTAGPEGADAVTLRLYYGIKEAGDGIVSTQSSQINDASPAEEFKADGWPLLSSAELSSEQKLFDFCRNNDIAQQAIASRMLELNPCTEAPNGEAIEIAQNRARRAQELLGLVPRAGSSLLQPNFLNIDTELELLQLPPPPPC